MKLDTVILINLDFGAIHDCISIQCPSNCDGTSSCACCPCETSCDCKGQFIMHPTDNSALDQFSTCSMKYMCSGIQTAPKNCLLDPGTLKTLAAGICGNGVVELGEDCDCGATCSTDKCCIGTTCKFTAGSTCDDLNDECCNSCILKPKGTLCRPSYDPCTYSQACTGDSGSCPSSVVIADGTSCKSNSTSATTCASGTCTSRIQQCKTLVVSGSYQTVAPCVGQDTQCSLLCQTASGVCLSLNGNFIGIFLLI